MYISILSIILLGNCVSSLSDETSDKGCLIPGSTGSGHRDDLLKTISESDLYGKSFSYADTSFVYKMNVCGDVSNKLLNATLVKSNMSQPLEHSIGNRLMTDIYGSDDWIFLSFETRVTNKDECNDVNDTITSYVMFLCDREEYQGNFTLLYEDKVTCRYVFELRTVDLCTRLVFMSGWAIFFLVLFLSFVFYFLAGFIYLRCVVGAKGVEQVPHRAFWFKVGNVFADSCDALCRCDRYCGVSAETGSLRSPYSDYSPIGGTTSPNLVPASQSNDPDTTLLNP